MLDCTFCIRWWNTYILWWWVKLALLWKVGCSRHMGHLISRDGWHFIMLSKQWHMNMKTEWAVYCWRKDTDPPANMPIPITIADNTRLCLLLLILTPATNCFFFTNGREYNINYQNSDFMEQEKIYKYILVAYVKIKLQSYKRHRFWDLFL